MLGDFFRLRLKVMSSDDELKCFADGFSRTIEERTRGAVKGNVPLEYLRGARVVAVVDGAGQPVAGYIINTRLPLRLLEFVPSPAREQLAMPDGASWEDCVEITCVWRARQVSPFFMGIRVWLRLIPEVIRTGRRFLLGGNQSTRLDTLYDDRTRVSLYVGPSSMGLPSRLFTFETKGLWRRILLRVPGEALKRLLRGVFGRR